MAPGGVLSSSRALSGSVGCGSCGRMGDEPISSSSAVALLEDAGEVGDGRHSGEASTAPSCADARGDDEESIEDVFAVSSPDQADKCRKSVMRGLRIESRVSHPDSAPANPYRDESQQQTRVKSPAAESPSSSRLARPERRLVCSLLIKNEATCGQQKR